MKLSYLLETVAAGAISAGSIAANPFTTKTPVRRRLITNKKKSKMRPISESSVATFDVTTAILFEFDQPSLPQSDKNTKIVDDTNDKVSNAIKRSQVDDKTQTTTFGLQDADGKIVKVVVNRQQAEDFESRLNSLLSDTESPKEIAEILYMLKQDYEIVDVEWEEAITEDEEDDSGVEDNPEDLSIEDGEPTEVGDDTELDADAEATPPAPDLQSGTVDLLQQVINLLKAETESRTANAQVATATAQSTMTDIEQQKQDKEISREQEVADMEEFEEEQKETKKNERLISRLAKFRASKQNG